MREEVLSCYELLFPSKESLDKSLTETKKVANLPGDRAIRNRNRAQTALVMQFERNGESLLAKPTIVEEVYLPMPYGWYDLPIGGGIFPVFKKQRTEKGYKRIPIIGRKMFVGRYYLRRYKEVDPKEIEDYICRIFDVLVRLGVEVHIGSSFPIYL